MSEQQAPGRVRRSASVVALAALIVLLCGWFYPWPRGVEFGYHPLVCDIELTGTRPGDRYAVEIVGASGEKSYHYPVSNYGPDEPLSGSGGTAARLVHACMWPEFTKRTPSWGSQPRSVLDQVYHVVVVSMTDGKPVARIDYMALNALAEVASDTNVRTEFLANWSSDWGDTQPEYLKASLPANGTKLNYPYVRVEVDVRAGTYKHVN